MTDTVTPVAAVESPGGAGPSQRSAATRRGEIHHTHRDVTGGWLRPAVFGAMDGVVSNGALVAGVAAAHASPHTVVVSGLAGLLAGSFSMAVGEWTSVQSQAELVRSEIETERAEIELSPDAEEAELAALFHHRGLSRPLAKRVARELSRDPDQTWRIHVREELGIDPDEQPSPYLAAASSFVTFGIGALVPLLPYLLGAHTLVWSLVLGAAALLLMGGAVARFTRRPLVVGALRQLLLGAVTVAVVFGVGAAVGAGVST
jgi:VIT1/CCC1 family predicted Fe2+/Mn2+ transporter